MRDQKNFGSKFCDLHNPTFVRSTVDWMMLETYFLDLRAQIALVRADAHDNIFIVYAGTGHPAHGVSVA